MKLTKSKSDATVTKYSRIFLLVIGAAAMAYGGAEYFRDKGAAQVSCNPGLVGYDCVVTHTAGPGVTICWTLNAVCLNGTKVQSNSVCQTVAASSVSSVMMPYPTIPNFDKCDTVTSLALTIGNITEL